jgi:hypothetical protein
VEDSVGIISALPPRRGSADRLWLSVLIAILLPCWPSFSALTWPPSSGAHPQSSQKKTAREPSPGMYVPPNEQHPAVALPIWQQSNHETYVSVGTERSFIGAAVTQAAALVVVDYDPKIVQFAEVNRALLAASQGREDYLALRWTAPVGVWLERAAKVSEEDGKTLRDENSWTFWKEKVRENTGAWSAAFEHFNKQPDKSDGPFAQTNYLFDDQLYERLHQLAKSGRIWARVLDLRDEKAVRKLCEDMHASGLKLGVLDTSNVPDASEAGPAAASKYVAWFSEWAEDNTLFVNTERANRQSDSYWSYFAFTGKVVKGRTAATIERWYKEEIAKLQVDSQTRANVDDPDVVTR